MTRRGIHASELGRGLMGPFRWLVDKIAAKLDALTERRNGRR